MMKRKEYLNKLKYEIENDPTKQGYISIKVDNNKENKLRKEADKLKSNSDNSLSEFNKLKNMVTNYHSDRFKIIAMINQSKTKTDNSLEDKITKIDNEINNIEKKIGTVYKSYKNSLEKASVLYQEANLIKNNTIYSLVAQKINEGRGSDLGFPIVRRNDVIIIMGANYGPA